MSKSTTSKQTNEPPAWSKPLLEKSAAEAMRLYDSGIGYNTYTGPTQAPLSAQTLGGMNAMMAATGGGGAPITNESINKLIPSADIKAQIEAMKQRNMQQQPQQQQSNMNLDRFIPAWVKQYQQSDQPYLKNAANRWMQQNYNNPNLSPLDWNRENPYGGRSGGMR